MQTMPVRVGIALLVGLICVCLASPAGAFSTQKYTWQNVQIVGGGFVDGFVFSPKQSGLVYVRTDIGGMYRWDTTTSSWIPLLDGTKPSKWWRMGVESIAVDPNDANRVYAAVGEYPNFWDGDGAILRSDDQGATWQTTGLPFKNGSNWDGRGMGERLQVDPNDGAILYFGTRYSGLWKSANYGATWAKVATLHAPGMGNSDDIGTVFEVFDASSGTVGSPTPTIYVGVAGPKFSLYVSKDAGITWNTVPDQPKGLMPHHGVLSSSGVLYLSYSNGPGPNGATAGAVWKYNTISGKWGNISPIPATYFGYGGLSVDAQHPGTVMVATLDRWYPNDEIFRSTDAGAHWIGLFSTSTRDDSLAPWLNWGGTSAGFGWWIESLEIDPFDSNHVLYGTGATIWASDDVTNIDRGGGTDWSVGALGLEETAVLSLISPNKGAHLVSGVGDIGGFVHDTLDASPPAGMCQPIFSNTSGLDYAQGNAMIMARVGYGSSANGCYSSDGGATWSNFSGAPESSGGAGEIAISADGSVFVWSQSGTPSYSTNLGTAWTACSGVPVGDAIISDRQTATDFYALDSGSNTLYASTDGAQTFAAVSSALPSNSRQVAAAPGATGDLWLTGSEGLYHSTDGGQTFPFIFGVDSSSAIGFGAPATKGGYPAVYLIGSVDGVQAVFRSADEGVNWVKINDAAQQFGGGDIITGDPRIFGRVYMGTNGRGVLYADPG